MILPALRLSLLPFVQRLGRLLAKPDPSRVHHHHINSRVKCDWRELDSVPEQAKPDALSSY
jgi:hypothetical protein